MESIELSPLGTVSVVLPSSYLARLDLMQAYGTSSPGTQAARLFAAAIGMCWADPTHPLPAYDAIGSHGAVLEYGARVIEMLVGKYKIPPTQIWPAGRLLAEWLAGTLPTEAAVEAAADFTSPGAE